MQLDGHLKTIFKLANIAEEAHGFELLGHIIGIVCKGSHSHEVKSLLRNRSSRSVLGLILVLVS